MRVKSMANWNRPYLNNLFPVSLCRPGCPMASRFILRSMPGLFLTVMNFREVTSAYFRRFLIVPFDVTIPPEEQIKDLHSRIIENELAGVFNWVLRGLARLLKQNGFTECIAARRAVEDYRLQSDSLRQFLNDERYKSDVNVKTKIVDLYIEYKCYCQENGFYHLTKPNFIKRLKSYGIQVSTINVGNVAYLKKHNSDEE